MDDSKIIELYFARNEDAITETKDKYGRLLLAIAQRILGSFEESEECENDTYLRTWNAIPPTRPEHFCAFLSKITRNIALNRLRSNNRRMTLEAQLIVEELSAAIPDSDSSITEDIELRNALDEFIGRLDKTKRIIFLKRYFYMKSINDIAAEVDLSSVTVKVVLSRTRKSLHKFLTERGINI